MSKLIGFKDYLNEVSLKTVREVRKGKTIIVKKCLDNDGNHAEGYKKEGDKCEKMTSHEMYDRKKGSVIASRKRHNKEGAIERQREKSMKKRTWDTWVLKVL